MTRACALILATGTAAFCAQAADDGAEPPQSAGGMVVRELDLTAHPVKTVPTSCFWIGAVTGEEINVLWPDKGATYWVSQFRLPSGSRLRLNAEYPHARYISFTAYNSQGNATDGVNDLALHPESGSANPFVSGTDRTSPKRRYVLNILDEAAPARAEQRQTNTLYARSDETVIQLYYRVYVPDAGKGVTGGVGLPEPELVLADGSVISGSEMCNRVVLTKGAVRDRTLPRDKYLAAIERPGVPSTFPALTPPQWESMQNPPLQLTRLTLAGSAEGDQKRLNMDQTRRGGAYPTFDNRYMMMYVDRRLGPVMTLKGQMPTTPATRSGARTVPSTQLRYWSLCMYRSLADTSAGECLTDEDVVKDAARQYTIVVSRKEDRPSNARPECGITWLDWGEVGDGVKNKDGGFLAVRNMLPSPDFKQSLHNVNRIDDVEKVLGRYYPSPAYSTKAAFEKKGCHATTK
jgi:hypothetical protein